MYTLPFLTFLVLLLCDLLQLVQNVLQPRREDLGMLVKKKLKVVVHLLFGFLVGNQHHDVVWQFIVNISPQFFLQ